MTAVYEFIQIAYWLALSTWFGGLLFLALGWLVIYSTVKEANPVLPDVLSVNLEGQHGSLLAGTIVANLIARFTRVQLICAAVLLVTMAVQFIQHWQDVAGALPRLILFVVAVSTLIYDWRVIAPKIQQSRKEYLEDRK